MAQPSDQVNPIYLGLHLTQVLIAGNSFDSVYFSLICIAQDSSLKALYNLITRPFNIIKRNPTIPIEQAPCSSVEEELPFNGDKH